VLDKVGQKKNAKTITKREMLSAFGHWLTIQLKKVFMGKEKKDN